MCVWWGEAETRGRWGERQREKKSNCPLSLSLSLSGQLTQCCLCFARAQVAGRMPVTDWIPLSTWNEEVEPAKGGQWCAFPIKNDWFLNESAPRFDLHGKDPRVHLPMMWIRVMLFAYHYLMQQSIRSVEGFKTFDSVRVFLEIIYTRNKEQRIGYRLWMWQYSIARPYAVAKQHEMLLYAMKDIVDYHNMSSDTSRARAGLLNTYTDVPTISQLHKGAEMYCRDPAARNLMSPTMQEMVCMEQFFNNALTSHYFVNNNIREERFGEDQYGQTGFFPDPSAVYVLDPSANIIEVLGTPLPPYQDVAADVVNMHLNRLRLHSAYQGLSAAELIHEATCAARREATYKSETGSAHYEIVRDMISGDAGRTKSVKMLAEWFRSPAIAEQARALGNDAAAAQAFEGGRHGKLYDHFFRIIMAESAIERVDAPTLLQKCMAHINAQRTKGQGAMYLRDFYHNAPGMSRKNMALAAFSHTLLQSGRVRDVRETFKLMMSMLSAREYEDTTAAINALYISITAAGKSTSVSQVASLFVEGTALMLGYTSNKADTGRRGEYTSSSDGLVIVRNEDFDSVNADPKKALRARQSATDGPVVAETLQLRKTNNGRSVDRVVETQKIRNCSVSITCSNYRPLCQADVNRSTHIVSVVKSGEAVDRSMDSNKGVLPDELQESGRTLTSLHAIVCYLISTKAMPDVDMTQFRTIAMQLIPVMGVLYGTDPRRMLRTLRVRWYTYARHLTILSALLSCFGDWFYEADGEHVEPTVSTDDPEQVNIRHRSNTDYRKNVQQVQVIMSSLGVIPAEERPQKVKEVVEIMKCTLVSRHHRRTEMFQLTDLLMIVPDLVVGTQEMVLALSFLEEELRTAFDHTIARSILARINSDNGQSLLLETTVPDAKPVMMNWMKDRTKNADALALLGDIPSNQPPRIQYSTTENSVESRDVLLARLVLKEVCELQHHEFEAVGGTPDHLSLKALGQRCDDLCLGVTARDCVDKLLRTIGTAVVEHLAKKGRGVIHRNTVTQPRSVIKLNTFYIGESNRGTAHDLYDCLASTFDLQNADVDEPVILYILEHMLLRQTGRGALLAVSAATRKTPMRKVTVDVTAMQALAAPDPFLAVCGFLNHTHQRNDQLMIMPMCLGCTTASGDYQLKEYKNVEMVSVHRGDTPYLRNVVTEEAVTGEFLPYTSDLHPDDQAREDHIANVGFSIDTFDVPPLFPPAESLPDPQQ